MTSFVLLDVDGVVAPIKPEGLQPWPPTDEDMLPMSGAGDDLPLLADLGAWLTGLPAQIVWVTTWGDSANTIIGSRLNLPECRALEIERGGDRWPKAIAVRDWLVSLPEPPEFVVWVDDHSRRYSADVQWALGDLVDRALVVTPGPQRGIDRADMRSITEFLSRAAR